MKKNILLVKVLLKEFVILLEDIYISTGLFIRRLVKKTAILLEKME